MNLKPTPEELAAIQTAPTFGFSIQNDGKFVAFHVNMPFASHVFAIPTDGVDAFADDFAKNMKDLARQAKQQQSNGFVVASEATMNVLKGK